MNLYSLIFLLTIASFTPGPNNLLASYSGLNFGFKRTLPLIHGVALGWGSILILLCWFNNYIQNIIFYNYT